MKALKSELAKKILSDPRGREQLRVCLSDKRSAAPSTDGKLIEFSDQGIVKRLRAVFVQKAA